MPSGFFFCVKDFPNESGYGLYTCKYEVQHEINTIFDASNLTGELTKEEADNAKKWVYLFYVSHKQYMPQIESMSFWGYCIPKLPGKRGDIDQF